MDLWIRSQDRHELVRCSRIKIEEGFETKNSITRTYYTIYNFDGVHINWLGEYKTKERALEVLDEIQNEVHTFCGFECANYKVINVVYEMPKE